MADMDLTQAKLHRAIEELITTYNDLNPSTVDELTAEPSPLEFMRYVARNRPFIVRGGANDWPARKKWTPAYLEEVMGDSPVQVAMTPHGNADSIIELDDDNEILFVKPYETEEPFRRVLRDIQDQERHPRGHEKLTRYAQTQNNNLPQEYPQLAADLPHLPSEAAEGASSGPAFARIGLARDPDATNFWLGNSHSTTALHRDHYENVYAQVVGRKHFVLLPPGAAPGVGEVSVQSATYALRPRGSNANDDGDDDRADDQEEWRKEDLVVELDEPATWIPFPTYDPDAPTDPAAADYDARKARPTPFSTLLRPIRLTLEPGDLLYLPALWWHKVAISTGPEAVSVSVNWWYDLDFEGGFWPTARFVRSVGLMAMGRGERGEEEEGVQVRLGEEGWDSGSDEAGEGGESDEEGGSESFVVD